MDNQPARTVLYDWHLAHAGKTRLAEFAGYFMPLWYSSIAKEHTAVRTAAGLFDVTHMGVLAITGPDAASFLNAVTTNDVLSLSPGQAQYSYILDHAGSVLDDIIVYCRRPKDNYMLVVNAANEQKIRSWLARPDLAPGLKFNLVDLRNPALPDAKIDLALQGPASIEILGQLMQDTKQRSALASCKGFHFVDAVVANFPVTLARTGYTGSKSGCEIFVHPANAVALWNALLEAGNPFGLEPCGLGARDSLRIEAGLPLYGHELDGPQNLSPFEAGYPWAVKLEKPVFIGKESIIKHAAEYNSEIVRIELPGAKGIRPARPGDAVLDRSDTCVGSITSCAGVGDFQLALVCVKRHALKEGDPAAIYYLARNSAQLAQGRLNNAQHGKKLEPDIRGLTLPRFARF